jgi:hypothetical protein
MQRGETLVRPAQGDAVVPLVQGARISDGSRLSLGEGAEITIRTASYREITIHGPATAEVCSNGDDGVLLARGRISAFPGTGVRPGVEVWVATPLGVVRYSDAKIDLEVARSEGDRMTVNASIGQAEFVPAPGVRVERGAEDQQGPPSAFAGVPVKAGVSLVAVRPATPLVLLMPELVHACTRESDAAAGAETKVAGATPGDGGSLGERASAYVRAKRRARAACESARAAAALGPGALDGSLLSELRAADEKRNQLTPLPARR